MKFVFSHPIIVISYCCSKISNFFKVFKVCESIFSGLTHTNHLSLNLMIGA